MVEHLEKNAELVRDMIEKLSDAPAAYDEQALRWLDGYIERNRAAMDDETRDKLIGMFGCFLGECCIRAYGGSWSMVEGNWHVVFDEKNSANPLGKAWKRFEYGDGDSLASFYSMLGEIRRDPRRFSGEGT